MVDYIIASVVERARAYPNTFEIPSEHTRKGLKVGDNAKILLVAKEIGLPGERPWVTIRRVRRGDFGEIVYEAELANGLVIFDGRIGDPLFVTPDQILQVE